MTWNQISENILCNSEYYVNICNDVSNNDLLYDNLVNQRTYFRNYFTNTFQFFSKYCNINNSKSVYIYPAIQYIYIIYTASIVYQNISCRLPLYHRALVCQNNLPPFSPYILRVGHKHRIQ